MPGSRTPHFALLTVFFPMWNEEEYIERALASAREACRMLIDCGEIGDYELLVIDDASTDLTGTIAYRIAAADPRVRVVHHPKNRKLGGSLKTGFASARSEAASSRRCSSAFCSRTRRRTSRFSRAGGRRCRQRADRSGCRTS